MTVAHRATTSRFPRRCRPETKPLRPILRRVGRPIPPATMPMSDRTDRTDGAGEIENPEDLPPQVEVTEQDGVTRIDIAEDATTRPGDSDPRQEDE